MVKELQATDTLGALPEVKVRRLGGKREQLVPCLRHRLIDRIADEEGPLVEWCVWRQAGREDRELRVDDVLARWEPPWSTWGRRP
jgi:hypothetical protein